MSVALSRRRFLYGAGALGVVAGLGVPAFAQGTGPTQLKLTSGGYVKFPSGVQANTGQRVVLGRIATDIARRAPSRAAANASINTVARTLIMGSARGGLYGIGAAVVIGGVYSLVTGTNPLDLLLDLSGAGSDGSSVSVSVPCSCSDVPTLSGSYPDTVTMGWSKASNCSTSITYRVKVVASSETSASPGSTSANSPGAGWNWAHTSSRGGGVYWHFYSKNVPLPSTQGCGTQYLEIPGNVDLSSSLSASDKLKVASGAAIDAIAASVYELLDSFHDGSRNPADAYGGFAGGGGGFGGGGAGGSWVDAEPLVSDAVAVGAAATPSQETIIPPLPQTGTETDDPPPTVGDFFETWDPAPDPGNFEFPPEVLFPEDPDYPDPEPTPTPTPTPTDPAEPGEGWDWTSWLPDVPDFGLPSLPSLTAPELLDWAPGALSASTITVACVDPDIVIGLPDFFASFGAPTSISQTLAACQFADAVAPIVSTGTVAGATIISAKKVLEL